MSNLMVKEKSKHQVLSKYLSISDFHSICSEKFGFNVSEAIERSLYSLVRGSEPLLHFLLERALTENIPDTKLIIFSKTNIKHILLEEFIVPEESGRLLLKVLLVTGTLSLRFIKKHELLRDGYELLSGSPIEWVQVCQGEVFLNDARWVELLVDIFPVEFLKYVNNQLLTELQEKYGQGQAFDLALYSKRYDLAQNLLQDYSTELLHRLDLPELKILIDRLEHKKRITNPMLLLDCIRCNFMLGDVAVAGEYFERLMCWLDSQSEELWLDNIPEQRRSSFKAGLHLYANLLGATGTARFERIESAQKELLGGAMPLLQEAFSYSKSGEFEKLSLTLQSGFYRSDELKENALYVVFSITYFWVLLLTCRTEEAKKVLETSKENILSKVVAYPGAHEWLLIMDVLNLRLCGNLRKMAEIISSAFLDKGRKFDSIQRFYLTILLAEYSLIVSKEDESRELIQQVIDMQTVSSILKTFWLPGIQELQLFYDGKFSDLVVLADKLSVLQKGLDLNSDLQTQNLAFQVCKLKLHMQQPHDIASLLLELEMIFTRTSQWLRLCELQVLKSVKLLQLGESEQAMAEFTNVVAKLHKQGLLGVLIDPLLVWVEFLRLPFDFAFKLELEEILNCIGVDLAHTSYYEKDINLYNLSRRETEVLQLLAKGLTNKEIATSLNLSVTTIRTHLQNIYGKLGVNTRSSALAVAYKEKLV